MTYILLASIGLLGAITLLAIVLGRRDSSQLSNKMSILIKAQKIALEQAQSCNQKLDWVRIEQQQSSEENQKHHQEQIKAFEHQRKSMEHQRVLLASLNRQMQKLDTIYDTPDPDDDVAAPAPPPTAKRGLSLNEVVASQPRTSLVPQNARRNKQIAAAQAMSFSDLLGQANDAGSQEATMNTNSQPRQGKSALIKGRDAQALGLRRVVNG